MKTLIIGGGVVGVTTAYYLAQAGVNVTLVERCSAPAMETSAGNAGFISPSDAFAWASPSALKMGLKSLFFPDMGIKLRPGFDPQLLPWSLSFLNQCRPQKWRQNSEAKYRLAAYSLTLLAQLQKETGIQFDALSNGIVYACRDTDALIELEQHFKILRDQGLQLKTLNRDELHQKNPALNSCPDVFVGAIYSPTCKTGDSKMFSNELVKWCSRAKNCQFYWNTEVQKINMSNGKISSIQTSKGDFKADNYVLCAGPYSGLLSRQIGINLPIYPVKGFSISAPIINPEKAPSTGFDDVRKMVAISRIGDRIRISSSAVFSGFDLEHGPKDFKSILSVAHEVFPDAADYEQAQFWSGLRPMTPSSRPIIGASSVKNLFINTGHGHLGWTLACASGRITADIMTDQKPEFDF